MCQNAWCGVVSITRASTLFETETKYRGPFAFVSRNRIGENVLDNADLFLAINDGRTYYAYQSDVFETNPALAKLCFDYDVPSVDLHGMALLVHRPQSPIVQ